MDEIKILMQKSLKPKKSRKGSVSSQHDNISGQPAILRLPLELHQKIFNALDNVGATCLGLTCTSLYFVYNALFESPDSSRIRLDTIYTIEGPNSTLSVHRLHEQLTSFMGSDYIYGGDIGVRKFIKKDRYPILEQHYEKNELRRIPRCNRYDGCQSCLLVAQEVRLFRAKWGYTPIIQGGAGASLYWGSNVWDA